MSEDEEIIIEIAPSAARRWMATLSLAGLSILLFYIAIGDVDDHWRLFFALLGLAVGWACYRLRQSTLDSLILTREALRTGSGRVLTTVDNVERVNRGIFAFRPSNGFLVRLKAPSGQGWALGLWWQRGRHIGIGGTLGGGQTRAMADLLAAMVLERDGKIWAPPKGGAQDD